MERVAAAKGTSRISNGDAFDLTGRKVSNPVKGLYIKDGRKVIIK
ncbi:MAG: hypothetical protein ACI4TW_06360 [Prevotella sp.]